MTSAATVGRRTSPYLEGNCTAVPNDEDVMTIGRSMLPEFDQEMTITRRVIARVPDDDGDWKPHPRSFSMAHLAQLVTWIPGWIGNTATQATLELTSAPGYSNQPTTALLAQFDRNVAEARSALDAIGDTEMGAPWSLTRGGTALWTAPRGVVIRNHISHLIHHRGQLTVYLRLRDVPVPSIYGPSADERMSG